MKRGPFAFLLIIAIFIFATFDGVRAQGHPRVDLPTGVSEQRLAVETLWRGVRQLPLGQRPRIILVLGGGGARGLAHIGVLRVLEEEQIPVDEIVGVSVGALIGSLYAGGLTAEKIEMMAGEIGWSHLTNYSRTSFARMFVSDDLLSTA
jgi:hypothetical protein